MAEPIRTKLQFVRKHIVRYMQCNLHPVQGLTLPNSMELRQLIAFYLTGGFAVHVQAEGGNPHHTPTSVNLLTHLPPLEAKLHNDLIDAVTALYNREFYQSVDHLHGIMRVPLNQCVITFRNRYGISEDDYPLLSSLRTYQRYCRKNGYRRRRGRPMLPAELLKSRRTRDLARNRPTLFSGMEEENAG